MSDELWDEELDEGRGGWAADTVPWPGVASAPGTYDRIVAEVRRRWPEHEELHRIVSTGRVAAGIEFAVHITISMLQQDPAAAPAADTVPRAPVEALLAAIDDGLHPRLAARAVVAEVRRHLDGEQS